MLNDKRIKSCVSRFASGAYSRLYSFCVRSAILSALIRRPYSRVTTAAAAAAARTRTRPVRRQQRRLQRRRNQQRQQLDQPLTTAAQCASWRHVLASHWCRADMHSSVNRVLCACQIGPMAAGFFVCRADIAMVMRIFPQVTDYAELRWRCSA